MRSHPRPRVVHRSLLSWVLPNNLKWQVLLVAAAALAVLANVVPLEVQKRIVNEAVRLKDLRLLAVYCAVYAVAFTAASALKYCINILQTVVAQRTVATMRKELYAHIMTLPLGFFRKTQAGLVITALNTELATAGDFIGMAVAVPVVNVLTLLAFAGYLLWLNPFLALVSLSIYPAVLLVVPVLQKRVDRYNRKRVDASRRLSARIGESVSGIEEIHAHGTYETENHKFGRLTDGLRRIRIVWRLYRYAVKATNSFFSNLGRFLIFSLGGYLAIEGRLELGALVAFLSAQEKLYNPWKELIEFYQAFQTASVTYRRTMEYFDEEPDGLLAPLDREPYDLGNRLEVRDLSFVTQDGTRLLDRISFSVEPGEHVAVVGFSGSGKSTLVRCLLQLVPYTNGHVLLGGKELSTLTKKEISRNMGYVPQRPFTFEGSIEENLLYGVSESSPSQGHAGHRDAPSLDAQIEAVQQSALFADILRFGLNSRLDRQRHQELAACIVTLRQDFLEEYAQELDPYIEWYEEDRYLRHSSIAENLLFAGLPHEPQGPAGLLEDDGFVRLLQETGLEGPLIEQGARLVVQTSDVLPELAAGRFPPESCPIQREEVGACLSLCKRLKKSGLAGLSESERSKLLAMALRLTPAKHKLVSISEDLERCVLANRETFRKRIASRDPERFAPYERSRYIPSLSILNNILFGTITTDSTRVRKKMERCINQLLIRREILESVLQMGLQFQVGTKGENLSGGQRQKLTIARAFLKRPSILVLDEATSALDNASQGRIQESLEDSPWRPDATVISVVHRLDVLDRYDKVAVMKSGQIVQMGGYEEMMESRGPFYELARGRG